MRVLLFKFIQQLCYVGCVALLLGATMLQADRVAKAVDLDPRVKIALGLDEELDYHAREQAVRALPKHLAPSDAQALFQGIIEPLQAQGIAEEQWFALYNDTLNALSALETPLTNYTDRLLTLIGQEDRDEVLRDYALQHLLAFIEYNSELQQPNEQLTAAAELALATTETTLPGTYLLGIWQQAGKPGYPTQEQVAAEAHSIAADPEAFTPNRTSAIQICGQLGYQAALPVAIELAQNESAELGLRTAAIATIGDLSDGDASHHKILTQLKRWGHPRLQYAANAALKRI